MKLSEKIAKLRKREGLSQEDLANELDVSRQTVYKWESGLALPELEKIKNIAKRFEVSFDYLMDDEIESYEKKEAPRMPKNRGVYYTGEELPRNHADIDNGYVESRKAKIGEDNGFFEIQEQVLKNVMEEIGATEVMKIIPDANTACFYIKEKGLFGLYYSSKIQFVCPIENFIDFEFEKNSDTPITSRARMTNLIFDEDGLDGIGMGSIPYQSTISSNSASATLRYFDGDEVKEINLNLAVGGLYLAHDANGDFNFWNLLTSTLVEGLIKNLKAIRAKLSIEKKRMQGAAVANMPPIDREYYDELNKELAEGFAEHLEMLEESARSDNSIHGVGSFMKFLFAATVIGAFVAMIIALSV